MLTHRNIVANVEQSNAWLGLALKEGREIVITAIPLYHIFALTVNLMLFIRMGANNVLIADPRDMPGFVRTLGQHKFSIITGVNTLYNGLLNTNGFKDLDFSELRLCVGGGAAVQKAVAERWQQATGATLIEGFGLTETSPAAVMNPVTNTRYSGTIGAALPSTEVKIVDDSGRTVEVGDSGELCIRGPQVMAGYWQRPEESKKALAADGWFFTGDIAKQFDNGEIAIVDRKKDMILVSGFNVFPNEVEDVLMQLDGILECAVVGVADAQSGEAVKAFIVKKQATLTEAEVISFCRKQLTAYKVPKQVTFIEALPKSNVGKILRRELRDVKK
jgi:long-chain acyl-CoA synthetase